MKKPTLYLALAALTAAGFTSCIQQEQKFVLNPDGSGKLVLDASVSMNLGALGGGGGGIGGGGVPKDAGRQMALQVVRGTQGVDVWQELTYSTTPDGGTKVHGVAYFSDISKLTMNTGEAAGGISASTLGSRMEDGKWIIEVGAGAAKSTESGKPATPGAGGDVTAAIKQAQQQWQAAKALIAPMVQDAKVSTTVEVGGTIDKAVGFSKESDSTGLMAFDGGKVVESIDRMMADTKGLEEAISATGDANAAMRDQKRIQKALFEGMTDGQGLPKLVVTPGKAVFDYKAEVEKARAGQSAELKALLEDAKKPASAVIRPPAGGGGGSSPEKGKVVPPKPKKLD